MRRQKTRPLALLLSLGLVLGLAGCGSMLERSYASVTPHTQFSDESDSGSVLRAETYQGLVSALLHLVEQGAEKGELRLYQYSSVTGAAASDVDQACLEVTQEDPLGAYAVDYIKYDVEQTVSYYQIDVKLAYNIDPKELKDVISVTGSTARPAGAGGAAPGPAQKGRLPHRLLLGGRQRRHPPPSRPGRL